MDSQNPYAPSRASLAGAAVAPAGPGDTWRDSSVLVLSPGASLPHRCIKCNEPAEEPTKTRKVYWHNPWIYLLILVNILLYVIVALIVRKKAAVAPGLCSVHKRRRRIGIGVGWTLVVAGFGLMFMAGRYGASAISLGVIVLIAGLVVFTIVTRILRPSRIDAQYVRLRGCGSAFLDSLPQFPG